MLAYCHVSQTAVMFLFSTPRALPHFVQGVFFSKRVMTLSPLHFTREKTKQKIVRVLESLDYLALNDDTPVAKA